MSIGVIAVLKIQDGKTDEFEAFFGELAKQVREIGRASCRERVSKQV